MKTVLEQRGLIECWRDAQVFTTPYGGKYVYNIAGTTFCVHLKDADEVSFLNSERYHPSFKIYLILLYRR